MEYYTAMKINDYSRYNANGDLRNVELVCFFKIKSQKTINTIILFLVQKHARLNNKLSKDKNMWQNKNIILF